MVSPLPLPPFRFLRFSKSELVIFMLVGLCCAVEFLLVAADAKLLGTHDWRALWLQNGAFWQGLLQDWQPNYAAQPFLMFGTYAFLHAGPIHLIENMLAVLWLAPSLNDRLGSLGFCLLFLTSALGGALCFALLSTSIAPMVGASGIVFGFFGSIVALDFIDRGDRITAILMSAILIAFNGIAFLVKGGVLAWETHLGGFLTGIIVIIALKPPNDDYPRSAKTS